MISKRNDLLRTKTRLEQSSNAIAVAPNARLLNIELYPKNRHRQLAKRTILFFTTLAPNRLNFYFAFVKTQKTFLFEKLPSLKIAFPL